MDPTMSEWMNLGFRWLHVIAGVMWIGHLYFFNFVNGKMAAATAIPNTPTGKW